MAGLTGGVLVVNAGSSSIKLALFAGAEATEPVVKLLVERIGADDAAATLTSAAGPNAIPLDGEAGASHETALAAVLPHIEAVAGRPIAAVGHRVVHGGAEFSAATLIDPPTVAALTRLVPLARTHQPHSLAAIGAIARLWPDLPQVACFDTAFHATIPESARTFALPLDVREAGVRRYGFHGLSYQWLASVLPAEIGTTAQGRVVAAHLGNGASLCGMVGLKSRATTMGFTPLDGLVMGERPGLTDPGAILFMVEEMGLSIEAVRERLFKQSGLLGLSGISNDLRTLAASDAPAARMALDVYVHRIVREIGAMAAEIGGLDALVFTGGVGENAVAIRAAVAQKLGWLGVRIEPEANARNAPRLSPDSHLPVLIVPANEEAVIARETAAIASV